MLYTSRAFQVHCRSQFFELSDLIVNTFFTNTAERADHGV
ncbi:hypothetical protein X975_12438, partial [Stegodyphus mimosarum]